MKKMFLSIVFLGLTTIGLSANKTDLLMLREWGSATYVETFTITRDEAKALVRWNPHTNTTPPVTMSKVIADALPLVRRSARGWPWRITNISLVHGQDEEAKDIWFYEVGALVETTVDKKWKPVSFHIVVLMNGKILVPEIEVPLHSGPAEPDPVVRPEKAFETAKTIQLDRIGLSSGQDYRYEITRDAALKLPDWYAESGKPVPLETQDILERVQQRARDLIPGQEWILQSYRLMCGGKGGGKAFEARHISYYSVALLHRSTGSTGDSNYWNMIVLLDGTELYPDPLPIPVK